MPSENQQEHQFRNDYRMRTDGKEQSWKKLKIFKGNSRLDQKNRHGFFTKIHRETGEGIYEA